MSQGIRTIAETFVNLNAIEPTRPEKFTQRGSWRRFLAQGALRGFRDGAALRSYLVARQIRAKSNAAKVISKTCFVLADSSEVALGF